MKSLHESIDTSSSSGKLIFHLFGALAEFERRADRACAYESAQGFRILHHERKSRRLERCLLHASQGHEHIYGNTENSSIAMHFISVDLGRGLYDFV